MVSIAALLSLGFFLQIPPPDAASKASEGLRKEQKAILDDEKRSILALIETLQDDPKGVQSLKAYLPTPPRPDGASRYVLIPEVVEPLSSTKANVPPTEPAGTWPAELSHIRSKTAKQAFKLAEKALASKHYALADSLLRDVIDRNSEQVEARRLLGQVPYQGGWATTHAVDQLSHEMTLHPKFGWVKRSWVPHLENSELPAPGSSVGGKEKWLPEREANAIRSDFRNGWKIATEHFKIQTNVPLDEAIAFGRHLEALQEVFQALFADVIGDNLPLAQRFRDKKMVGEKPSKPHSIFYYADRDDYINALRPTEGDDAEISLGIYLPAESNRSKRGQAYFFRDQGGELDVTATLFHEVSHQLLLESDIGKVGDFRKNRGNYWVFEGLGTYFETFTIGPDGQIFVGGMVGPRFREARKNLPEKGRLTPIKPFVLYDESDFKSENVYERYQQAEALALFLMQADDLAYRENFLIYVRDACLGRLGQGAQPLDSRVKLLYSQLETKLKAFLKDAPTVNDPMAQENGREKR